MLDVIHITPIVPQHAEKLEDFIYQTFTAHTHFDWHSPLVWIKDAPHGPSYIAWHEGKMVGALALSSPLNGASWIRLLVLHHQADEHAVLMSLWSAVLADLSTSNIQGIYILMTQGWQYDFLESLGFVPHEEIITLQREHQPLPPNRPTQATVATLTDAHIAEVVGVDNTAFSPPWQMTHDDLHHARRISLMATGAWMEGQVVGYQMTTHHSYTGHLARLAVLPSVQGHGVAHALLQDLVQRLSSHNIHALSVNTQATNHRSQGLYKRFGFRRNGFDLPVWHFSTSA